MEKTNIIDLGSSDIIETEIRDKMPEILDLLLIDRTSSTPKKVRNIIWGHDNYIRHGREIYNAESQIQPILITGQMGKLIKPRSIKSIEIQKERTKAKAEVFTPTWIVKKQNDEIDKVYKNDSLKDYIDRRWLEITCGEAPYMCTRYDMEIGELIELSERVGFLDRKLTRINNEINDKAVWQSYVEKAYKACYGFEWSGDSLLLARENLLYSYFDYYKAKWDKEPDLKYIREIAEIISYNVFQMDGLTYTIPLSEKLEESGMTQLSFFDEEEVKIVKKPGKRVKVMNWDTNKLEFFDKDLK